MAKKLTPPRMFGPLIFFCGVVFSLTLLEISLRMFAYWRAPPNVSVEGDFRVICIGGSHTEGSGADPARSYCAELQRILIREGHPGARTYNLGRAGWNSHQIREKLPLFLDAYRPQLVIAMIGEPNTWNYNGLQTYLAESNGSEGTKKILHYFFNLRIAQLVRLLASGANAAAESTHEMLLRQMIVPLAKKTVDERSAALEEIFRRQKGKGLRATTAAVERSRIVIYTEADPMIALRWMQEAFLAGDKKFQYSLMATAQSLPEKGLSSTGKILKKDLLRDLERSLAEENLPEKAKQVLFGKEKFRSLRLCFFDPACRPYLGRIIEMEPENLAKRTMLNVLLHREKDLDALTELAVRWLRWNPVHANEVAIGNIVRLQQKISRIPSQAQNSARIKQAIEETIAEIPSIRNRFDQANNDDLAYRWVAYDLAAMAATLRERNVPLILQTFPPQRLPHLPRREIDKVVLSSCQTENCTLSDTWSVFAPLSGKLHADLGEIFSNKFGHTDSHLNETGHAMVAEKLARDVLPLMRP